MKIKSAFLLFLLLVEMVNMAYAESAPKVVIDRYTVIEAIPTNAQADLLTVIVKFHFPKQVQLVGEALDFALRRSGYKLDQKMETDPGMKILVSQFLPRVHRKIGPVTLEDALKVIAGVAYNLEVNHLKRTIAFVVSPKYQEQLVSLTKAKRYKPETTSQSDDGIKFTGTRLTVVDHSKQKIILSPSPFVAAKASEVSGDNRYGPVTNDETLWQIAEKVRPDNVTVPQAMMAILDTNPKAFRNRNINDLYSKSMLLIPPEKEISGYDPAQASQQVNEQYKQWRKWVKLRQSQAKEARDDQ